MSSRQVGWDASINRKDNPYRAIMAKNYEQDRAMVLIDARLASYASFHTRRLSTSDGRHDTSVTHGLIEMIQGLCEAANTRRFCLVWDGAPSYRRRIFKGYKLRQDRERTPEEAQNHRDLVNSMNTARKVGELLNWPQACMSEMEADDLIGIFSRTLLKHAVSKGIIDYVVLVTEDKDYYQLIDGDRCVVYRHRMSEVIDQDSLHELYGLTPDQYVDYKALIGEDENGDNIPHVDGIGDKTARKLIGAHKNITKLHAHLDELSTQKNGLKSKRDAAMYNGKDITWRAYRLSRILRRAGEVGKCYPGEHGKARHEWIEAHHQLVRGLRTGRTANLADLVRFKSEYEFESFNPQRWGKLTGYRIGL